MKLIVENLSKQIVKIGFILFFTSIGIDASSQIVYTYDAAGNRTFRKIYVDPPKSHANSDSPSTPSEQDMKIAMDNGISVYPNPADDMVNVTVSSANTDTKAVAYLIDNAGRVLFSKEVSSVPFPMDLKEYVPGIYFIKVIIGNEQLSYRIIKSK